MPHHRKTVMDEELECMVSCVGVLEHVFHCGAGITWFLRRRTREKRVVAYIATSTVYPTLALACFSLRVGIWDVEVGRYLGSNLHLLICRQLTARCVLEGRPAAFWPGCDVGRSIRGGKHAGCTPTKEWTMERLFLVQWLAEKLQLQWRHDCQTPRSNWNYNSNLLLM